VKNSHDSWQDNLKTWLDKELSSGKSNIIEQVLPEFEKILLESALKYTQGHKQEAAKRLGWGRNTLTRKLKELNLPD
jgi:two-component system nitrogen regulation response regulator GlnG